MAREVKHLKKCTTDKKHSLSAHRATAERARGDGGSKGSSSSHARGLNREEGGKLTYKRRAATQKRNSVLCNSVGP